MKWLKETLEKQQNPDFKDKYIRYKELKKELKSQTKYENETYDFSNKDRRQISLAVDRKIHSFHNSPFYKMLYEDIDRMDKFIKSEKNRILNIEIKAVKEDIQKYSTEVTEADKKGNNQKFRVIQDPVIKEQLLDRAQKISNHFKELEKYANLNFEGFYKILKKHDKFHKEYAVSQQMFQVLASSEWRQGSSQMVVEISELFSKIRHDPTGEKNEDAAQNFVRSTTKYWVKNEHITSVKLFILEHLPVFIYTAPKKPQPRLSLENIQGKIDPEITAQEDKNMETGDSQLVSSTYLDNRTLELYHGRLDKAPGAIAIRFRWYGNNDNPERVFVERKTHLESWAGQESVKERILLPANRLLDYINKCYNVDEACADMKDVNKNEKNKQEFQRLFTEMNNQINQKRLCPLVRTQYMRSAFQIPYDATVRVSMDTSLCMIREDVVKEDRVQSWKRDPRSHPTKSDIVRFPHAVLEIKLSLKEGMLRPQWVSDMLSSGKLHEVHKFSKFCFGTAILNYNMIHAIPYYLHDVSLRDCIEEYNMPDSYEGSSSDEETDVEEGGGNSSGSKGDSLHEPLLKRNKSSQQIEQPQGRKLPILQDIDRQGINLTRQKQNNYQQTQQSSYIRDKADKLIENFTDRVFGKLVGQGDIDIEQQMRVEPKTHFANERTYLSWLTIAITLGSISSLMISMASNFEDTTSKFTALYAIIIMILAIIISVYGLQLFFNRNTNIRQMRPSTSQEKVGPIFMGVVAATTVCLLIVLSVYHLIIDLQNNML